MIRYIPKLLLTAFAFSFLGGTGPVAAQPIEIKLETVAQGFTAPLYLTHAGDGSGRLFVVDQPGRVRVIKNGVLFATPFLDITSKTVTVNPFFDERGLLGIAFHPNYRINGRFFLRYSAPRVGAPDEPCSQPGFISGCHEEILAEYRVQGNPVISNVADPNSEIILFRVDEPQFNHNSGQVAFGPDGLLYWTLGDGGGANDGLADTPPSHGPNGNGQNVNTALGSLLRIDVDGPPDPGKNYAVPPGNPFAGGGGVPEIYAYGFRNPYRFSFDDGPGGDGQLYVGDVGQDLFEELDILPVAASPGLLNYGWVIREGLHCFDPFNPGTPPATCASTGPLGETLRNPILEYSHSVGIAIIGGFVYRGAIVSELRGHYVFGDFSQDFGPTGRLFYTAISGPEAFVRKEFFLLPSGDPLGQAVFGIGEDEFGELYVLASDNVGPSGTTGVVYRILPASETVVPASSSWGLIVLAGLLLTGARVAFGRRRVVEAIRARA